jgi:hypothetical protein
VLPTPKDAAVKPPDKPSVTIDTKENIRRGLAPSRNEGAGSKGEKSPSLPSGRQWQGTGTDSSRDQAGQSREKSENDDSEQRKRRSLRKW